MNNPHSAVIADLNDLIQLDHDAVGAYTIAIDMLRNDSYRELLAEYRADHKRHIEQLSSLVRERGGVPLEAPHPTGPLKMAVQSAGALAGRLGGDHLLLLAFKAVEGQARDRYRRHAAKAHEEDVQSVIDAGAADEDKHYRWVSETLREMGYGEESLSGQLTAFVEGVNRVITNPMERAGRTLDEIFEELRPKSI
jgi:rubrerythrin